jgi:hypothetical protein
MGSIAMDKNGDIALGFSAASSSTYPSVLYEFPHHREVGPIEVNRL